MRSRPLQSIGEVAKQPDEELGTRQVNVSIGDGYGAGFDPDDDDVSVGLTDIVLDRKSSVGARCRRRQSGMAKFEFLGGIRRHA